MKRFLMTTAVAALVPMYALAQEEPADGTVLPTDDPAATAQADTDAMADPMAEDAEADVADAEEADPMAEDGDSDMADAEDADPMAGDAADSDVADADAADPAMEGDDPAMADGADPAAEIEDPAMADSADPAMTTDDPAMADSADPMAESDTDMAAADGSMGGTLGIQGMVPVSAISGGVVYTTTVDSADQNWEGTASYDAVGDGWERIGSIQDVVLSSEGKIEGIVAEVGGFLGIGDKFVMLPTTDFKLVPIDEDSYAVVTPYTTDQLTDMQEYDSSM